MTGWQLRLPGVDSTYIEGEVDLDTAVGRKMASSVTRQFEAEVVRRVRQEAPADVHREPIAQNVERLQAAFGALRAAAIGLTILPFFLFFPVTLTVGLELVGATDRRTVTLPTDLVLAPQSVVMAVVVCVLAASTRYLICSQRELAVVPFFPISDRQWLLRSAPVWLMIAAYFIYAWGFAVWMIGSREKIDPLQIAGMAALAVLQGLHLVALAIVLAHWLPAIASTRVSAYVFAFLATILVVMLVFAVPTVLPPQYHKIEAFAGLAFPTGWISGAMAYGVIEGKAAGWLFLAPAVIAWIYAAWWVRRGFAIREFRISSNGELSPVFESGLLNRRQ
jgi:hypothetical protein